jgi:DNA gyrase subunit B
VANPTTAAYNEADMRGLEGPEAIRMRPGMYVGGTDVKALHHLVQEVVDNSIDEAMAGRCDYVEVIIHQDESVTINDNGVGIPVGINAEKGISTLTAAFTILHFGAKFGSGAYTASGGLHGIGVKAVNALSDYTIVEVRRDGYLWRQEFSRGYATSDVEQVRPLEEGEVTGTSVTFKPDGTVMQETIFSFDTLETRFRQMAYLVKGVMIRLVDERVTPVPREISFYFEGGIPSFVRYLNRNRSELHKVVGGAGEFKFKYSLEGKELEGLMAIDFAVQYTDSTNTLEMAFANTINTADGGTHLTGMRTAITRVLNNYARKAGFLKDKDSNFTGSQTLEGLTSVVSIRHPNPQFENQTKGKLMNTEVSGAVSNIVAEAFTDYLENNPKESKSIIEKCLFTQRVQDALAKQRELLLNDRKTFLSNTTLPGKLADCAERGSHTEVFIVEGDSAGGSAKQARDRHFQAILPVFGKMLNTERVNINKILESEKIKLVIMALGTGIREDFNVEKLRYGKVILMSDADVDGAHIRTLMLTFFYRYMQPIITEKRLYIAQPPLFRLEYKKQVQYIYPESKLNDEQLLIKSLKAYNEPDKVGVQRYKGLGEMNPEQLWETTMNPEKRTLLQITLEDAAVADRTFDMLMGPEVPPRRSFIIAHSKDATLDV